VGDTGLMHSLSHIHTYILPYTTIKRAKQNKKYPILFLEHCGEE